MKTDVLAATVHKSAKDADARPESRSGTRRSLWGVLNTASLLHGFLESKA